MITAKIKYIGKRTGFFACYFASDYRLLGKYENFPEMTNGFRNWVKTSDTKPEDWNITTE